MRVLYGDSAESGLDASFLEGLRDAMDFTVAIAHADEVIATAAPRLRARQAEAEGEAQRLESLARALLSVLSTEAGAPGTTTAMLAEEIGSTLSKRHHAIGDSITAKLSQDIRQMEAEATAARALYQSALHAYLLRRDPPGAQTVARLTLVDHGKKEQPRYEATLTGQSDIGLAWSIELGIPEKTTWATALRIDRIVDAFPLHAPQSSGLIKKEVKVKKQKLDRHFVTSFVDDGITLRIALRTEPLGDAGFDLSANPDSGDVTGARIGPEKDAAATFDGAAFDGTRTDVQPGLVAIVGRLAEKLAPTVREISMRSHAPDELVLRRMLQDGRREEIFLPKATLRDKLAPLGESRRAMFDSLELGTGVRPVAPPREAPNQAPEVRSEVPPSIVEEKPVLRLATEPPVETVDQASDDELVSALKAIRALVRQGRMDDAYIAFAAFFTSSIFTSARVDEQRAALRLMVLAPQPNNVSDAMRAAHEVVIGPLQALILAGREPADYELLGVAYVATDQPALATQMFKNALDIERARDPGSDLCGNLMRRVSQL